MGVAAVDTYLHWAVQRIPLNNGHIPKSLQSLKIDFQSLVDMADTAVEAKSKAVRPTVKLRNSLSKAIQSQTFQSPRQVETALQYIGIEKCWKKLSKHLKMPPDRIQKRLNRLASRRNRIVHEGDIQRNSRPRRIKHERISRDAVQKEVDWIQRFVEAIELLKIDEGEKRRKSKPGTT